MIYEPWRLPETATLPRKPIGATFMLNREVEAETIQAIRARRMREGAGQIVHAPSDKLAMYLARHRLIGPPVGRLAREAVREIERETARG